MIKKGWGNVLDRPTASAMADELKAEIAIQTHPPAADRDVIGMVV